MIQNVAGVILVFLSILASACGGRFPAETQGNRPGLAGTFFKGGDFTRPKDGVSMLPSLDNDWGRGKGNDWAARWAGYVTGPYDGEVKFSAVAGDGVRVLASGKVVIDGLDDPLAREGSVVMEKGVRIPLVIEYFCSSGNARLHLSWEWSGHGRSIVPASALSHDASEVPATAREGWPVPLPQLDFSEIPGTEEHGCVLEHVTIYDQPGRYAGWPANGGFWMWGDEMAVAFESGWFKDKPDWEDGHARDYTRPNEDYVARSLDGGRTWTWTPCPILSGDDPSRPSFGGFDFSHPDFAMKLQGTRFYLSADRARTWKGPFRLDVRDLPDDGELQARTCYLDGRGGSCRLFVGFRPEGYEDLSCSIRTADGGKSFDLEGWISPDPAHAPRGERWMVYSAARLTDGRLVAALRRKISRSGGGLRTRNWIDVYESKDDGRTWRFLSKVADTTEPNSDFNGNPPSLIHLADGRLCVTYGFRAHPPVICARLSGDGGHTWSGPVVLRSGARNWDIGYTRTLQRQDGKVVTVYYFATPEHRNQYIEAAIWDPEKVGR